MIEILRPGALASVQDAGRAGARRFGVGTAGALDTVALAVGNVLAGNARTAAAIEFTLGRAAVRFHAGARIALTGAECCAEIDGKPLPAWHAATVAPGSTLILGAPRAGSRAYLCVAGGIDVPLVMGSRSTDLKAGFGGHQGRALRDGDRLQVGASDGPNDGAGPDDAGEAGSAGLDIVGVLPPSWALPLPPVGRALPIRMLPGLEYHQFDGAAHAALWEAPWTLTPQSNRIGFRLQGPPLSRRAEHRGHDLLSHGVVPGVMQVPPGGQPIVLMADAQTTGGYPKIGVVIEADLWRLAQAPLGATLRFLKVTPQQAGDAQAQLERYLARIEQALAWHGQGLPAARHLRAMTRPERTGESSCKSI